MSIYKKAELVLLGFLVAAIFSEIILRFLGFPASSIYRVDEETGLLTFRPNEEIYIRSECFSNVIETNNLGFHSKEYNLEKPEGVFRIAVIGDSFIEASQVPIEKTFAFLLEEKLNSQSDRKYKYEIIPFGISSHGTYKSLLYLKAYALNFKPDLVIAAYTLNDLEDDGQETIKFDEAGRPILEINPIGRKSVGQKTKEFFKRNLRKLVLITTLRKEILQLKARFEKKTINSPISENSEKITQAWEKQESLLAYFNEISKASGAEFLLLALADVRIGSVSQFEKLSLIAAENTFVYFDLMPIFKERAEREAKDFVWPCDGHWNETGNEWAADILFDFLLSLD